MYTDYVYPAFVSLLADVSLSFQKVFLVCFSIFSSSFPPCVLSFLSLAYWPFRTRLLACLIRAAILHYSFRLHLFTSRCFVIGIVLISDLLYQSAAFIFLDGSRVSEELLELVKINVSYG